MTVCIQCAMKHVVEQLEAGLEPGPPPFSAEDPIEHMAKHHPDFAACQRERADLIRRLEKFGENGVLERLLNYHPRPNETRH